MFSLFHLKMSLHLAGKGICTKCSLLLFQRNLYAEVQTHKSLIGVRGKESSQFLQGLVTNDINHLDDGKPSCMYSLLLNTQGRVLFDVIIHKQPPDQYIIECDSNGVETLMKHFKMYRVRRKVDIEVIDDFIPWAVFEPNIDFKTITEVDIESQYLHLNRESDIEVKTKQFSENSIIARDPRMKYLGYRAIIPSGVELTSLIHDVEVDGSELYRKLRYKLGVGEGLTELTPKKCLPLEANGDYLHGISFHKGCYIGQELTARTFHTGIVRKRFMPLVFADKPNNLDESAKILNEKGNSVGKLCAFDGCHGIGLMRIKETLSAQSLSLGGSATRAFKPAWWPIEVTKGKPPTS